MHVTIIETHPIPPSQRDKYVRHIGDEVTGQFAAELEPLLTTHEEGGPLTPDERAHAWWVGRVDQVEDCVTQLVGMPPNGLLSRYLPEVGGVSAWTQATWHEVAGLVVTITWRTQWHDDWPDEPVSLVRPSYDVDLWVPREDDAQLRAALCLPE
jgi:hypothetical protein